MTPERTTAAGDAEVLFPWRFIARTLTSAFRLRVLLLATVGVVIGSAISDNPTWLEGPRLTRWVDSVEGYRETPLLHWQWVTRAGLNPLLGFRGGLLSALQGAGLVIWWALIGGAIARIAAADLTHRPPAALFSAMATSSRQLLTRCLPLFAVGLASTALLIPLWLHGWVMNVPLLGVLSALLLPIPIALAMVSTVLTVLLLVNWLLLMACPAVEQTDAFDATSRAFAYVTQRPVRLFGYVLTALFVALPITIAASEAEKLLTWIAFEALLAPAQVEPFDAGQVFGGPMPTGKIVPGSSPADRVEWFWVTNLVARLPDIVVAAYTWCAAVAIYLLLRRDVDGVQLDELDGRA